MKFYLRYRNEIAIKKDFKGNVETERLEMLDFLLTGNRYN